MQFDQTIYCEHRFYWLVELISIEYIPFGFNWQLSFDGMKHTMHTLQIDATENWILQY